MAIYHCADAFALEAVFAERIEAAARGRRDPFDPVTVVAPTARLLASLRVAAGERLRAAANIQFLVHRSFATQILQFAGEEFTFLPASALAELAARSVEPGGTLASSMERFEAMPDVLLATYRDLRDAGVHYTTKIAVPERVAPLWRSYGRFERELEAAGGGDAADLYQRAAKAAPKVISRFGKIIHAGVYDLTGVVEDWILTIHRAVEIDILTIGAGPGSAFTHGRARASKLTENSNGNSTANITSIRTEGGGVFRESLNNLFELSLKPAPAKEPIDWIECPGVRDELGAAARRILTWASEGVPLEEIAVVARSLEPYATILEDTFSTHGIVYTSSARVSARRLPAARAALDLLHCVVEDFPRGAWVRFLKSTAVRRAAFPKDAFQYSAAAADLLSRKYMISGAVAWTEQLPDLLQSRGGEDSRHARIFASVASTVAGAAGEFLASTNFTQAVSSFENLVRRFLVIEEGSEGIEVILTKIGELAALDKIHIPYGGPKDFYIRVARAADAARESVARRDRGGVRVLDLQQSRGLYFKKLILIGFHEGSLPRTPREDSLLSDADRATLSIILNKTIPLKMSGREEEPWLFALLLSSVAEKLIITWQRQDENGRPRDISPFARWLRRVDPIDANKKNHIFTIPFHPARRAREIERIDGMIEPSFAIAAQALHAKDRPAALLAAASALGDYLTKSELVAIETGAEWLKAVDSFSVKNAGTLQFDGVAAGGSLESIGATSLERLGLCPLRFFFYDILKLRKLEEPENEDILDRSEIGLLVHRVLADLYQIELLQAASAGKTELIQYVNARLAPIFDQHFSPIASGRLRGRPAIAAAVGSLWKNAILQFVLEDARRLAAAGVDAVDSEVEFNESALFDSQRITIRGRFDRVARSGGNVTIADYKTKSGELKELVKVLDFERGKSLQLAIYKMIGSLKYGSSPDSPRVEALSVRPDFTGEGAADPAILNLNKFLEKEGNIKKTIGVLLQTARDGRFPITLDETRCNYCDFQSACRKGHAPTVARVAAAKEFSNYYQLTNPRAEGES